MPREEVKTLRVERRTVIGTIVVVIVALTCVRLGIWQLHRLDYKRHRNATAHARMRLAPLTLSSLRVDSAGLIYRRALVSGTYDDARTIIVAGRALNGSPGVHVLTPVRVGNVGVLVNRGWLPSADAASANWKAVTENAPHDAVGLILDLPYNPRSAESDSGGFRHIWYRLNITSLQKQFPYPLANYVVQLLPAQNAPQLPRRLSAPELDEGPHLGYAIQWFGFATIAVIGWLILLRRK